MPISVLITVSNVILRFLVKSLPDETLYSFDFSETAFITDNKSFLRCLGFICDLLAIKIPLITRAAFATSLSFNSESGRTF